MPTELYSDGGATPNSNPAWQGIRVIDAENGELLRRLTLDPTRDYQPINNT